MMTTYDDPEKLAIFNKIVTVCNQRMSFAKSKQVEQQGGYAFKVDAPLPTSFNFGGDLASKGL